MAVPQLLPSGIPHLENLIVSQDFSTALPSKLESAALLIGTLVCWEWKGSVDIYRKLSC